MKIKKLNLLSLITVAESLLVGIVLPFQAWALTTSISLNCFNSGADPCTFSDLVQLVNQVVSFLLYFATLIAVFLFIYAGATYIFAAGNPSKISKAHGIFWSTAIGLIITFAAWLIVEFILSKLGVKTDFILVK